MWRVLFLAALPLHVATEACFQTGTYSGDEIDSSRVQTATGADTCQSDCEALDNPGDAARHCKTFTYIAPVTGDIGTCHLYTGGAVLNAAGVGTSGPREGCVTGTATAPAAKKDNTKDKSSSSGSVGDSLDSSIDTASLSSIASSLTSSSLSSLPRWAVLLLFALLALALCGALAMAMKKPKKKKTKRAKKTEEVPIAPVVETIVAPAVVAAPIQTYSVPYAQPQVVEYVQPAQVIQTAQYAQPSVVEYIQQPQMVEYVQQPQFGSIVQGAPVVSYVQ